MPNGVTTSRKVFISSKARYCTFVNVSMCARVPELKVKESLHFAEALRPADDYLWERGDDGRG